MIGLIRYDLMQMKGSMKGAFLGFYLNFLLGFSAVIDDGGVFSFLIILIGGMLGVGVFNLDAVSHWDRYTISLPLSTRQIVLARYGFVGVCIACSCVLAAGFGGVASFTGHMKMTLAEWLLSLVFFLLAAVLHAEVMLPILYYFGAERGRVFSLMFFFLLFFGINFAADWLTEAEYFGDLQIWMMGAAFAVVVIVLLPVSIAVSVRSLSKKEL